MTTIYSPLDNQSHYYLAKLARHYQCYIIIYSDKEDSNIGSAGTYKGRFAVRINKSNCRSWLLSVLFHELGHVYCRHNNIWLHYHLKYVFSRAIKVAWKAEKWVCKWGSREMKKWFPQVKFVNDYNLLKNKTTIKRIKLFYRTNLQNDCLLP